MKDYSAKVVSILGEDLDVKEKISFKDISITENLNDLTKETGILIAPNRVVTIEVHNEKSENKDYIVYVLEDKDGNRYSTSSKSFMESYENIYEELTDAGIKDFEIKIYQKPSKNFKGGNFLTCSLV